jgi:hypothetical protein
MDEYLDMENLWNNEWEKTAKHVGVPPCLPQIPHGLAWDRTLGLVGEKPPISRVSNRTACPTGDGKFRS